MPPLNPQRVAWTARLCHSLISKLCRFQSSAILHAESLTAFYEALAERIRKRLARSKNIEAKKLFSGIGFLLNGNLLVGVRKDSLLVRVGLQQSDEALQEAHVSEFKITGRGTMKGWVVVSLEVSKAKSS
jgi:TfoX/Sxy family transcriptional regulator of competence genes